MKKLQANINKKYTDKGYTFFTDVIYAPDNRDESEFFEVDDTEATNIQSIKADSTISTLEDIDNITAEIEDVDKNKEIIKYTINSLSLTVEESLNRKDYYPIWEEYLNKSLPKDFIVNYQDNLYQTIQPINVVLDNQTPDIVYALYHKLDKDEHAGTIDDPIPYEQQMKIEKGKYYSQYGITYLAIQSTNTGMPFDLKDMPSIVTPV